MCIKIIHINIIMYKYIKSKLCYIYIKHIYIYERLLEGTFMKEGTPRGRA